MTPTNRLRGRPKNFESKPAANTIQALDRALDVLEDLSTSSGLTLSEIASRLDQSPSTIYRVLSTLEARDVVEIDPAAQTWHVGPAAFRFGSAFLRRSSVVDRSRPVMRQLMADTGETANLGIEKSGTVFFVSQVETNSSIRAFFPPGTQSAMHASGIGKALLGQFDENQLARFLRKTRLDRFTDKTITDADQLRAELDKIRDQGFAYDDEERNEGMRCIAAPIIDLYGEAVAGISVSGPTHRMTAGRIDEIAAQVVQAAKSLSRNIGAPDAG